MWKNYDPENATHFDELFAALGEARPEFQELVNGLNELSLEEFRYRQNAVQQALIKMGITFTLSGDDKDATERIFPFDIIPRTINATEWEVIEKGLKQRITALNYFLTDIYGDQKIIKDGIVPLDLIKTCTGYRKQCEGLLPPRGIWCHVTGTDLIRHNDGKYYVLEDNLRCPSGVSYVLENRELMKRCFPKIMDRLSVRQVSSYPTDLLATLRYLATDRLDNPHVVVLTPGRFNSAYFEHTFLAQQMGVELVEPTDLVVRDGYVQMRTTQGYERVDVIYRRLDDDFLDPLAFRPDSMLGVSGLFEVYRNGRVALANAPGTGVADDKAVYAYVERIIKYYLGEEAIINNVPTYICNEKDSLKYVLEHLDELVVKATDGAGGYGMLIGPHSTKAEQADFAERIKANPRGYVAQPTLCLSRVPTLIGDSIEPRHVDLRPFVLNGESVLVQPGGLTRVALKKGSLVVNSSQGGGSKDTWVFTK